jgi:glycosyltransferase involved in cell wall biosynthesis
VREELPLAGSNATKTVILDQYSLSGPGSDRGLGRHASLLAEALRHVEELEFLPLRAGVGARSLEVLGIQKAIAALNVGGSVPYHSTDVFHLPLIKNRPWICSILDIIPLDLDGYLSLGIKTRAMFANSRRSDIVIVNSAYTGQRVADRLNIPHEKIHISPFPVSAAYRADIPKDRSNAGLQLAAELDGRPYVIALADLRSPDPRKRFHWIADLAAALKETNIRMVVTGRGLSPSDYPDAIVLLNLSDAELAETYSNALATFYPSAYEGVGLPPLEAMAVGCPVIAFKNTSITEVVQMAEFLIDDPIPWEEQNLSAPLPISVSSKIVERLDLWATDPELVTSLRSAARAIATRETVQTLGASLAKAYSRVLS